MSDFAVSNYEDLLGSTENFVSEKVSKVTKKVSDKKITLLRVIVVILGFFLLVEGFVYSVMIPCFSLPVINYHGLKSVTEEEIEEKLQPLADDTWGKFNTEEAASLLSTISGFEHVSVEKKFPDQIIINVRERTPVAKTIVSVNNSSKSIQIDENGVLFSMQSNSVLKDNSIPLISGLPIENFQEGMRLPQKYRSLMEQISNIRNLPQKYFAAISEIQVLPKEYGSYELALYPSQAKVKVLTDRTLNEDALKYMMVVLDVVNSIESDVSEIDLRYGAVSYKHR